MCHPLKLAFVKKGSLFTDTIMLHNLSEADFLNQSFILMKISNCFKSKIKFFLQFFNKKITTFYNQQTILYSPLNTPFKTNLHMSIKIKEMDNTKYLKM